ncbi:MAG: aldo/keto reductase [Rhodobacteraceae bacterium]|nr:aldo/keto reductase [Paracoccaceae bacterium]
MSIIFERSFQRAFGTWPLQGEVLHRAVLDATAAGYRHFDTAQMYGNEAGVGAALAASGVKRDELCITTKVHPANYDPARFLASVEQSLAALGVDRVDLLLLHWPVPEGNATALGLLGQALARGLTRAIGVSNFTTAMMREARALLDAPIACNQVEFHPLLDQSRLLAAATETGIPLAAYSSIARGRVFDHAIFAEIGRTYGRTAGQVVLRWILQKGVATVTMSTKPANIRANFDVMDFTLSSIDMDRIAALAATGCRVVRNGPTPGFPVWD